MEFDDETNSHRINPSYARIYYNYDAVLTVVKQPPPSSILLLLFYLFCSDTNSNYLKKMYKQKNPAIHATE